MKGFSYAHGSPNLYWMDHLTLEELQCLYVLTKVWQEDKTELAFADDFDHLWRLAVRKLTSDTGYQFRAGITVDESLEVWIEHTHYLEYADIVYIFLDHMGSATMRDGTPWANYESASYATLLFLERELPQEDALRERVREEIQKIDDAVLEARLTGPPVATAAELDDLIRGAIKGGIN